MQEKELLRDSRESLDNLESVLYDFLVRLRDVIRGLGIQAGRDEADLRKMTQEREKLYSNYLRFRELEEGIGQKSERLSLLCALMLNAPQTVKEGNAFDLKRSHRVDEDSESPLVDLKAVSDFPLWRIIREIVRQTPEMQVISLEHTLKALSINVSRAAIESALETHNNVFDITWQGRKKFVALKGARDASSTKPKCK